MKVKIVSIMITIVMVCSIFSTLSIVTSASEPITWNGTTTQPTKTTTVDGVYYYEISSAEELAYIAQTGGDWEKYNYILMNDIVLNEETLTYDENFELQNDIKNLNIWKPIELFSGILNGNGHSISGMVITDGEYTGFIRQMNGKISNVKFKNSYVYGQIWAGGICTTCTGVIEDTTFNGVVKGGDAGGICSQLSNPVDDAEIYNCTNYGTIIGGAGIVAHAENTVKNCVNYGNIKGSNQIAGICRSTSWDGLIDSCTNYGMISGENYVAGIVAKPETSYIRNCKNYGDIFGKEYVGGVCGYAKYMNIFSKTQISDSINTGCISGQKYVGGISGMLLQAGVSNSYNTGKIIGQTYIGGISGHISYAYISNSYNSGNIEGNETCVGGIAGHIGDEGDCSNNNNVGNVTSKVSENIGCIAGYSDTIWGKGVASNNYYLKNDTINASLNGFGNAPDSEGITDAKGIDFFCIKDDKTLNLSGHTYSATCDATCDNCGYEREVIHNFTNLKYDFESHWYECQCGEIKADSKVAEHAYGSDNICDVCGYEKEAENTTDSNGNTDTTPGTNGSESGTNGGSDSSENNNSNNSNQNSGCGSVIGGGAAVLVAVAGCGAAIIIKKKQK